jgi:hypothetical protein
MMELFSEIYSCYYKVAAKILNRAGENALAEKEIKEIIDSSAFSESAFYIMPKLLNGQWGLLSKTGNKYASKLSGRVKLPLTLLQKAWLKAVLSDRRIALFLKDEQKEKLEKYLEDVEPLFDGNDFYCCDSFLDGDNYGDEEYRKKFHTVLEAVKNKTALAITFESGKKGEIGGRYIPYKIEYSAKDDKFRVYAVRVRYNKIAAAAIINIGRIATVEQCEEKAGFRGEAGRCERINYDGFTERSQCGEPVVIQISNERNALERSMLHFASYEKHTEYDEKTDKYLCRIYYNKQDETELLVRILSFGPVIKVLGPERFLGLVRERVERQWSMLSRSEEE